MASNAKVTYGELKAVGNIWTRVNEKQRDIAIRAGDGVGAEGIRRALEFWDRMHPDTAGQSAPHRNADSIADKALT